MRPIPRSSPAAAAAGFTLLEMLICVTLLVSTAGIVAPVMKTGTAEQRAARIVEIAEDLGRAVDLHYLDTGTLAVEFSGHDSSAPAYHNLTQAHHPRWDGPYLDGSLDNPCGGNVFLYRDFWGGIGNPRGGFDLTGTGRLPARGAGQFVAFTGVSLRVARAVNRAVDHRLRQGGWESTGRVEYDPSCAGGTLMIMLMNR